MQEERKFAKQQPPKTTATNVKALSSFIQSALNERKSYKPDEILHLHPNSKKQKLSTHQFVCDRWPGEEKDVDISAYSDDSDGGGGIQDYVDAISDHCEIEDYQDDTPHCNQQMAAPSGLRGTSTSSSMEQHGMTENTTFTVTSIESEDSEDICSTSPESADRCTPAIASPIQDQLQIENPSSPESPQLNSNIAKPSEWLLQVQSHSIDSNERDVFVNRTPKTPRGIDSAKKLRLRKFISFGLAERLNTIIKRESAEVAFFEHQMRMTQKDESLGSRHQLSLKILSIVNAYSLFIGLCKVLAAPASLLRCSKSELVCLPNTESKRSDHDCSELVTVFSPQTAGALNLRVGSHVSIYSPWHCIMVGEMDKQVILCPHFCEAVGFSPVEGEVPSPVVCHQKGIIGMSPLSHSAKVVSLLSCRLLTIPCNDIAPELDEPCIHQTVPARVSVFTNANSPESVSKSLTPTRLFSRCQGETASVVPVHDAMPALIAINHESNSVKYPNILEAIEKGGGEAIRFSAFIVRIYRQRMLIKKLEESQCMLSKSLLDRARHTATHGSDYCWCWAILLCDRHGTYAELQLLDESIGQWKDVIETGEGREYQISNVKVHHRATLSRAPEIFNLISSLEFHKTITQSVESDLEEVALPQWGVPSLYVLNAQQSSTAVVIGERVSSAGNLHHPSPSVMGCVDLLAKIVYTYNKDTDHSCLQPDCYMFVVLPHTGTRVLKTPSASVLLRDVEVSSSGSEGIRYSMNACSLLMPVDAMLIDKSVIYPQRSFDACELQLVASIGPPILPSLTHAVAIGSLISVSGRITGVDDENAYSWMACDTCGCSNLVSLEVDGNPGHVDLHCNGCEKHVSCPAIHLQLAVRMSHPEFKELEMHVELLQTTIQQLLPITASNLDEGFDVHLILNKIITLKSCYVSDVKHTTDGSTVQLEEVDAFTELSAKTAVLISD